jgi:hypothetical protein
LLEVARFDIQCSRPNSHDSRQTRGEPRERQQAWVVLGDVAGQGQKADRVLQTRIHLNERTGALMPGAGIANHDVAVARVDQTPGKVDIFEPQEEARVESTERAPCLGTSDQARSARLIDGQNGGFGGIRDCSVTPSSDQRSDREGRAAWQASVVGHIRAGAARSRDTDALIAQHDGSQTAEHLGIDDDIGVCSAHHLRF